MNLIGPVMSHWAEDHGFDHTQATREGWGLFHSEGSAGGPFQLQALDDPPRGSRRLKDDDAAWVHVTLFASRGSAYHNEALDLIEKLNPMERELIRKVRDY